MAVGTIRPMALSHLSEELLSLMISRRCHSALYWRSKRNFLPEVSHGSLARVQVLCWHSGCRALGALRARGSPRSNSILPDLDSSLMVQGSGHSVVLMTSKEPQTQSWETFEGSWDEGTAKLCHRGVYGSARRKLHSAQEG